MKLVLLIISIVLFIVAAIIGFGHGADLGDFGGWLASGLAVFAAAFLPLPGGPAL